jgi:hypothetical protein
MAVTRANFHSISTWFPIHLIRLPEEHLVDVHQVLLGK